jgi:hypothetical protein
MPLTNAISVINLQDANKKIIKKSFSADYRVLFEGTFTSFFKDLSQKEVTNQ